MTRYRKERQALKDLYVRLGSWGAVAAKLGGNKGTWWEIAYEVREPTWAQRQTIRRAADLPTRGHRTTINVDRDIKARLAYYKRDGATWDDFLDTVCHVLDILKSEPHDP